MMQLLLAIVSLTPIFSLTGMDNPHPEKFTTPEKVRVQIFETMHKIVEGSDQEADPTTVSPRLWKESPVSFSKGLRRVFEQRSEQELRSQGINPELVTKLIPEATALLNEECERVKAGPVHPSLKRHMSEVARVMKVTSPHCKSARLDNPGYCMGELVLIDEEYLHQEAPTPGRKKAILAHEMRHRVNRDRVKFDALLMAADVAGVDLPADLSQKICRTDEAFADFESCAAAPEFAESAERLTREAHETHGDGYAGSHPARKDRRALAKLASDLHKNEHKRKSRRNLEREFKDIWDE
jgi:hypothetical protein